MLLEKTIPEVLADSVRRNPDGLAIVSRHQNSRLTWAEVARQTARLAGGLRAIGIAAGDRVVVDGAMLLKNQ